MTLAFEYLVGDVRDVLNEQPADSVHCVVTSPPYYHVRDYDIPESRWADGSVCCLGWESDPDAFVAHLTEAMGAVKRVMRPDAVCWFNIGDKYAERSYKPWGVKPGDEMGVPDMVVRSLMRDGWYRRGTIIWNKSSFRPEGCTCRPHKSHEYIYMLTKRASGYYYDAEAVRQPHSEGTVRRWKGPDVLHEGSGAYGSVTHQDATGKVASGNMGEGGTSRQMDPRGAHLRTVWTFPSAKFTEDHIATFPPELPRRCIKASTSPRACPHCGAPWERVIEEGEPDREWQRACGGDADGNYKGRSRKDYSKSKGQDASEVKRRILARMRERKTVGWRPTCDCPDNDGSGLCLVLDPFAGTFTTGLEARRLGRSALGVDISERYRQIAIEKAMLHTPAIESYGVVGSNGVVD